MKKIYQKINIAKTQLGLSDDAYRDILELQTGKRSLKQMSYKELIKVLQNFKASGFVVKKAKNSNDLEPNPNLYSQKPVLNKIEAILSEIGRYTGKYVSWNYAVGILKQMFNKEKWEEATTDELRAVVTALSKELSKIENSKNLQ